MDELNFTVESDRIYVKDNDGKLIAEVTFPLKNGISTIDHTFVDESLRGQGVAGRLVKMAADKILQDGHKIAATCSYAATWLERHKEYSTVDTGAPLACRI